MSKEVLDFLRGSVRPVITFGLVAAFVYAAFTSGPAADTLGPPAMLILGFYFYDRTVKNRGG